MPKKRQGQALLIKPGSNTSSTLNLRYTEPSRSSVNDLISASRRLQVTNIIVRDAEPTASVPPEIRHALNIPAPEAPRPRPNDRSSPARFRRIPGPPPPRSWLTDSRHAPESVKALTGSTRLQKRSGNLPGAVFARADSLEHAALKAIASNWDWHAEYYGEHLADLPIRIREALLSYIAIYGDSPKKNALRLLCMTDVDVESRAEITRLDLTDAVGNWTTLKQVEKDLGPMLQETVSKDTPDSWDTEATTLTHVPSGSMFKNLRHLSLALSPGMAASWKDLLHVAEKVPTITSLSLANWPIPTYTPLAAKTRVTISSPNRPSQVYGGTSYLSAYDNDWREAAGILRSLSRAFYCLEWLDFSGCSTWVPALTWRPNAADSDEETSNENVGPEWNAWWRQITFVNLGIGWTPVAPDVSQHNLEEHALSRLEHLYKHDLMVYHEGTARAKAVAQELRAMRKEADGKWINFEF